MSVGAGIWASYSRRIPEWLSRGLTLERTLKRNHTSWPACLARKASARPQDLQAQLFYHE